VKRIISITGVFCLVLLASCGVRPSGVIAGDEAPQGDITLPIVFFVSNEQLAPATRNVKAVDALLDRLAAGPTAQERREGLTTELPAGITMRAEMDSTGPVIVTSVDPQSLSSTALDQIVCTVAFAGGGAGGGITVTGQGITLQPRQCGYPQPVSPPRPAAELTADRGAP
jgi:hypothetical protein